MKPIRVLVIDDSAFMRKMISEILSSDPRLDVVDRARNGEDGIQKIKELSPDVVTMDINMPVMDGISALQAIMRTVPVPVIMLSSQTAAGTEDTLKAIENGAVDFIMKPSGEISLNISTIKNEIISKVIAAASATVSPYLPKKPPEVPVQEKVFVQPKEHRKKRTIVVLGTSTGGPRALQRVVTDLPEDFTTPILIVQHMPPGFTKSLAKRLDNMTDMHVKEAEHAELVKEKTIYIAPGDYHMTVESVGTALVIKNNQDKPINSHRPAVDALFNSVADLTNVNKVAVVLTGMGSDGSNGIVQLKQKDEDCFVISEAKETSVIYGMPKAAVDTEVVDQVLPLHQLGSFLGNITDSFKSR